MSGPAFTTPELSEWIGRCDIRTDIAGAAAVDRLAALLDHGEESPWQPGVLPPLAHWLHFLPDTRQSALDVDGHPKRGGFMPPISLPRRMWVASRVDFLATISLGALMTRTSTISAIETKSGRSGELVLLTLEHRIETGGRLVLFEEQKLAYRAAARVDAVTLTDVSQIHPDVPAGARRISADPVQCFRYSALTFNAHRIHYDDRYARIEEGYPGLVVQGPYVATLLMDHAIHRRPTDFVSTFSFRAVAPVFVPDVLDLCVDQGEQDALELSARKMDGNVSMYARVGFATIAGAAS